MISPYICSRIHKIPEDVIVFFPGFFPGLPDFFLSNGDRIIAFPDAVEFQRIIEEGPVALFPDIAYYFVDGIKVFPRNFIHASLVIFQVVIRQIFHFFPFPWNERLILSHFTALVKTDPRDRHTLGTFKLTTCSGFHII